MTILVVGISCIAAGFIIGAVVIDVMYARMLRAAAVQPFEQSRYPVDLGPSDYFRIWEGQ